MKLVKMVFDTDYAGTQQTEFFEYDDDVADKDIKQEFMDMVPDKCEGYEYLINGWGADLTEEEIENFVNECYENSYWEYSTEEERAEYE
jgi:hypothetical protein